MSLIEGVVITPLKQIPDERGNVMHMFRSDDPEFEKFGEIYFSVIFSGMVKMKYSSDLFVSGWKE